MEERPIHLGSNLGQASSPPNCNTKSPKRESKIPRVNTSSVVPYFLIHLRLRVARGERTPRCLSLDTRTT
eukprot:1163612-Amphidinium_carterae.1